MVTWNFRARSSSRKSLRVETIGSVAKCRLFSQVCVHLAISFNLPLNLLYLHFDLVTVSWIYGWSLDSGVKERRYKRSRKKGPWILQFYSCFLRHHVILAVLMSRLWCHKLRVVIELRSVLFFSIWLFIWWSRCCTDSLIGQHGEAGLLA